MTSPLEVRQELVDALQLDLVGPTGSLGNHKEVLTQSPSRVKDEPDAMRPSL